MSNYKKAIQSIVLRRKNDILKCEQKLILAMQQNQQLHSTDVQIRSILHDQRNGKAIDQELLNNLNQKKLDIMQSLGLEQSPPFRCKKCCDTGLVNGKICACVITMINLSQPSDITFEDCDFSVFDGSDFDRVKSVYSTMLAFCEKFPITNVKNIILTGGTGTGKTFLASCIGAKLTENGFSVLFVSAFAFLNRMLSYHTAPVAEKLDYLAPVIDCDLLIIDDLGTESMLKNVTIEYLYSVLAERIRLNKHTMITTNYDSDMLLSRYGERIYSRLFDKRLSAGFILAQMDIRKR